jgi:hypothetical protein
VPIAPAHGQATALKPPTALVATAATKNNVALSWQGEGGNVLVERKALGGMYATNGRAAATTFADAKIEPVATYVYRIRAFREVDALGKPGDTGDGTMTVRYLTVGAAVLVALTTPLLHAQMGPYSSVKTFAGTAILEASAKTQGEGTKIETYRAEGSFTIADNQMPDGMHFLWPLLNPAELASKGPADLQQWVAVVTYTSNWTAPKVSGLSNGGTVTCEASEKLRGVVSFGAPPAGGMYVFSATPPVPQNVRCTGTMGDQKVNTNEPLTGLFEQQTHQGKAPGPLAGSTSFTDGNWSGTLKYSLAAAGK